MLRRSAGAISALALMLVAASPATAQTNADAAKTDKPANEATSQALQPAAQTPPSTSQPPTTQAPVETQAAAPPPKPVDPIIAQVRQQLAEAARGPIDRGDRAALVAFYADREGPPLWVTTSGFTARANNAMAEIAKADDWGLAASAFEWPRLGSGDLAVGQLADAEIKLGVAVLKYARYARGGRLDPSQISRYFDQRPSLRDPKTVLEAVAATDTPANYLLSLHPTHEQFVRLRQALLKTRSAGARPEAKPPVEVQLPDGATLKLGMQHAHVELLRERLKLPQPPGASKIYDLEVRDAVRDFQEKNGIQPTGNLTPRTRSALNGIEQPKPAFGSDVQRIIANMERWRWLPEDLGEFYVWDNIPEFTARVLKKGHLVHSAKIIVGKPETPTVVFSADMRYIVFHPEWGVPDSIKVKELLPYMRPSGGDGFFGFWGGSDTRVLQKHNLKVSYNGRPVDPSQVNWSQVDVRRFTFIQPAGPTNVLGVVKFRFPNKHDIYMHDTPQRELFERPVRLFSHGCMRIQNPGQFAELLLAEDKGWSAAQVRALLAQGYNNEVPLTRKIPVHVTYFTSVIGEDGQLKHFADVYGHDNRLIAALGGKPLPLEATPSEEPLREARRPGPKSYKQTNNDFFGGLFGN